LSTRDKSSGLIDADGCFWPEPSDLQSHLDVAAAADEMQAQVERMLSAGIEITHLDPHMGAALLPALLPMYIQLGLEYRMPILLFRQVDDEMRRMGYDELDANKLMAAAAILEGQGMLFPDWFRITPMYGPDAPSEPTPELYESILREIRPGVTHFSLHPNAPGDIETFAPDHARWRTFEYSYFRSDRLRQFLSTEGIVPIGYREIRKAMRDQ
jgi:predicted glycoside hydrolase/deacetylase ChbG (UPF0249 family)